MVDSWADLNSRHMRCIQNGLIHMSVNTYKELQSQLGLIYPDLIAEYKRVRKEE